MYSVSNRDFYVFYFCTLQSIIFSWSTLKLRYIDCAVYKVCNKFQKKITKISKNIFTQKVKDDNISHSQGKIYKKGETT